MMRIMIEFYGIIIVDTTEIILRVYKADGEEWQLLHFVSRDLINKKPESKVTAYDIAEIVADLFSTTFTQKVIEWRICARGITKETVSEIAFATGLRVEHLDRSREQELICKGMFTELW